MNEIEKNKKLAELSKKLEIANNKVEQYKKYLESDIRFGRDTGRNRRNLEYANKEYMRIKNEIDKLM